MTNQIYFVYTIHWTINLLIIINKQYNTNILSHILQKYYNLNDWISDYFYIVNNVNMLTTVVICIFARRRLHYHQQQPRSPNATTTPPTHAFQQPRQLQLQPFHQVIWLQHGPRESSSTDNTDNLLKPQALQSRLMKICDGIKDDLCSKASVVQRLKLVEKT